jgi:hypothetical protein
MRALAVRLPQDWENRARRKPGGAAHGVRTLGTGAVISEVVRTIDRGNVDNSQGVVQWTGGWEGGGA